MKYYIIAGERSGDLHASNLIKEIKQRDFNAQFRGMGGELSQQVGCELALNYEKLAFMGFLEVAVNLRTIFKALDFCQKDILAYKPDVVILIDYGGFNLRMAKFLKKNGIKVFYYIAPKIWAWNTGRVETIKKYVDKMFVTLPFEKDFYAQFNYEVDYVGNPVSDEVNNFIPNEYFYQYNNLDIETPIIAILPGSRKQEIEEMLHYMLSMTPAFMDFQLVIAAVPNLPKSYYEMFRRKGLIKIVYNQTYDLLSVAHAAIVTSGTATLETALFEVPQVVCYKTSFLTYAIAKAVAKVKYISLPNLIADRPIVPELIQDDFIPYNVRNTLTSITRDEAVRAEQKAGYKLLKDKIGESGASARTAELIVKYLN